MKIIYCTAGPAHQPLGFWTGERFSPTPNHEEVATFAEPGPTIAEIKKANTLAAMFGGVFCGGYNATTHVLEKT